MPLALLTCLSCAHRKKMRLFVAFVLLIVAAGPAFSAQKASVKAEPKKLTAEQQYKAAKDLADRLEREDGLGKVRDNWLNCAQTFRNIHTSERSGPLGPTSLFMAGKTYRRAFDLFRMPQDLEAAMNSFIALEDLYPNHPLADDALYEAAECAGLSPGKESQANDLYRRIVNSYPQGDQAKKAIAKLRPQAAKPEPSPPAPAPATVAQTPQAQAPPQTQAQTQPSHLAALAPVKYWSSDDYCRIVLQLDAPVPFSAEVLPAANGQNRQLAINLGQSSVDQNNRQPLLVRTGLLKAVRPDQTNGNAARIVLELASYSGYKIFSLPDPFRVIVDIRGGAAPARDEQAGQGEAAAQPAGPQLAPAPGRQPVNEAGQSSVISLVEQKKRSPQSAEMPKAAKGKPQEKLSLAQQLGLGIRKIVIDPGHGGKDPGAMAFGLKEKDVTLALAKQIAKILAETYHYEVVLTRTKDVFIPLEERTAIANTQKSDLFISVHTNAHSDQGKGGIETYFLNLATDAHAMRVAALENATSTHSIGEMQDILSTMLQQSKIVESTRLAQFVQSNLISGLGRSYKSRNLGVKQAPFYVLIGAEMPAILTEISFITNPAEAKLLQSDQYINQIAVHLAAGIAAYADHHHTAAVTL